MDKKLRVLLVEDNEGDVGLLLEALDAVGVSDMSVAIAKDGEQAVQMIKSLRPRLVILDLNIPKKSGIEVLKEIKGDPLLRYIPFIVLTSSESYQDLVNAYANYANSYVCKPYGLGDLMDTADRIKKFWLETAKLPN